MSKVDLIDTTIRDGQASLWAMNMTTEHMLPIMPALDSAGFDSIEFLATGSRLKKFVRHLAEDPWDWIYRGAAAAEKTPLRWHGQIDGRTMSGWVPPELGELLIRKAVEAGVRYTRTGNNWNDFSTMGDELKRFERLGMTPVVHLMYSVSPRHTDDYYVAKAKQLASLDPFRLCLKDVSGLLTPERTRVLVPKLLEVSPGIEWEFHGHCNNGLGPLNALECAKAGMRYIHTAIPPLANANSQPSVYSMVRNLRELGFEVPVDEFLLEPVSDHLEFIAKREGFQIGVPFEFDQRLYRHQIPGGMISNLEYQLQQAGARDRLPEVLEETARVRKDFGYPIMVTPLSQIVGSQAAINVMVGERYAQVTDETIDYAFGRHGGDEAIRLMDPDVRDRILDRPRAKEMARYEPPEPTIAELRKQYGSDISDEDLILRVIVGDDAVEAVRHRKRAQFTARTPLLHLVRELMAQDRHRSVSVRGHGYTVTVRHSPDDQVPGSSTAHTEES